MNIQSYGKLKQNVVEYAEIKAKLSEVDKKAQQLEAEVLRDQKMIEQLEQAKLKIKQQSSQGQKTQSNQNKVDSVQGKVLAPNTVTIDHQKMGQGLDKMITGFEKNRNVLIKQNGHESILNELDNLLIDLKKCKEANSNKADVSEESKALTARCQTLAAKMSAFAKASTAKK